MGNQNEAVYDHNAATIADLIHDKKITFVEVVQAHLDRTKDTNPELSDVLALINDIALKAAEDVDKALARAEKPGPYHGAAYDFVAGC